MLVSAELNRVLIMGAAGRDFHKFNVVYRNDPATRVVAFTAAQIPGIAGRRYPQELAGPLYPNGIPIADGTFMRAPGLLAFRLGAFVIAAQQQLKIVPLTLRGTRSILRGEQWFPRHGALSVHIGEPILPEGTDFSAAVRLRDKVRISVLAGCGEPDVVET